VPISLCAQNTAPRFLESDAAEVQTMNIIDRFLLTLSYVTALPLKRGKFYDQADDNSLSGLAKYLPSAGAVIGCILLGAGALCVSKLHAPNLVSGAVLTVAWIALTGGLHFDGLMDAADGIFSHRSRERMLEIMLDSRVGNFGAMCGMSVFLLKFAALSSLCCSPKVLYALLVVAPCWARWTELYAIGRFSYAKEEGKGKIWHDSTKMPEDVLIGLVVPVAVSAAAAALCGISAILMISVFACFSGLVASHWLAQVLRGHTGDTYGAVVELSETGCLLLTALFCCL